MVEIHKVCTQPWCPLRDKEAGPAFIAELVVRIVAGEDVHDVIPSNRTTNRQDVCRECAERVMHDLTPLLTATQWDRIVEAGHWSYRRRRRKGTRIIILGSDDPQSVGVRPA